MPKKKAARSKTERIEVVRSKEASGGLWQPVVGEETLELLGSLGLPLASQTHVRDEAVQVLARCVPPTAPAGSETGLVVGYVQSGKTMSFTTVAALARDNAYQMVIVITGISVPLLDQSTARLVRDLRLSTRSDRKWQRFRNPSQEGNDRENILKTLGDWDDKDVPQEERRTVLITVMKNVTYLDKLNILLESLPLAGRPAIVIDDEADQAGLNNSVRRGLESATYQRLRRLRAALPHHTYLQYTATPQAPLLINLIDSLSPRFTRLLTPGSEYVGGRDFFVDLPALVKRIPDPEIPTSTNVVNEPPETLLDALRLFFLGVAAGLVTDHGRGHRSMLVHPSQRQEDHAQYVNWVQAITARWGGTLERPSTDPDHRELVDEFKVAWNDLHSTADDLPPFTELLKHLRRAVRQTQVLEVNTRVSETPGIDWAATYSHILVGGQAMDRGFTVEGLTVTYMPRSLGVGNADNVQQRARFLGYKRRYLGYCRVFLSDAAKSAYERYVHHEEDIRARLEAHNRTGKSLTAWKREFFLTSQLRPTRRSVLGLDYVRDKFGDEWWYPDSPQEADLDTNRRVVRDFIKTLSLKIDDEHVARTKAQEHEVDKKVSLAQAFDELLTQYTVAVPEDSGKFTLLRILIGSYLDDHPDARCSVYVMSHGARRERSVDEDGRIINLLQGPSPDTKTAPYPGDRQIRRPEGVTIQIHNVSIKGKDGIDDVPTLAIWIPQAMAQDLVTQNQPAPD